MKKLRIDINTAAYAIKDKDILEAYAFAILIKQTFRSSSLNNTTFRHIKEYLHVGTNVARRCISNGLKYGFLRRENNGKRIVAVKNSRSGWTAVVSKNMFQNAALYSKRTKSRILTIARVKDIIREVVLMNHIRKQNDCEDTHKRTFSGQSRKSALRRERRMLNKPFSSKHTGISNARIQTILCSKRHKALSVVKKLVCEKLISKNQRWSKLTSLTPDVASYIPSLSKDAEGHVQLVWHKTYMVRQICSNTYRIERDIFKRA